MKYLSVKETAKKWGYSEKTIRKWCQQKLISVTFRAEKVNGRWQIPADAPCPKKVKGVSKIIDIKKWNNNSRV